MTTRASLTVAVVLCGGIAMLALWSSSRADPLQRADVGASRGLRALPARSFDELSANLGTEKRQRENPGPLSRDPFRFYVRPVPPAPHITQAALLPPATVEPAPPDTPPGAPMPWQLMAIVQRDMTRWAVFSDCRGLPVPIAKGASLAGQWRVTGIGAESVTLQSLDNRRVDLPLRGCPPR